MMTSRIAFRLTALTAALFLALPVVWACSCPPPPDPAAALELSSGVFLGKVTAIEEGQRGGFGDGVLKVTMDVERWYKGGDAAKVTVTTLKSGATCGFGFEKDGRYLIYVRGNAPWSVSLCSRSRTAKAAEASGDFKALGEGTKPK